MNSTYVHSAVEPSTNGLGLANETFQIEAAPLPILLQNATMVIDRPTQPTEAMNSIMTDDLSDEEEAVVATPQNQRNPIVRSAAKNHKELFK